MAAQRIRGMLVAWRKSKPSWMGGAFALGGSGLAPSLVTLKSKLPVQMSFL